MIRVIWINLKRRMRDWPGLERTAEFISKIENKLKEQALKLFVAECIHPTKEQLKKMNRKKKKYALLEIFQWRAEQAREKDVPPQFVVSDEDVMKMANILTTPDNFRFPTHEWFHHCTDARKIHELQVILKKYKTNTYDRDSVPTIPFEEDDSSSDESIEANTADVSTQPEIPSTNDEAVVPAPMDHDEAVVPEPMDIEMPPEEPEEPGMLEILVNEEDRVVVEGQPGADIRVIQPVQVELQFLGLRVYDHSVPEGLMADDLCKCYLLKHLSEEEKCQVVTCRIPEIRQAYLSREKLMFERDPEHRRQVKASKNRKRKVNKRERKKAELGKAGVPTEEI